MDQKCRSISYQSAYRVILFHLVFTSFLRPRRFLTNHPEWPAFNGTSFPSATQLLVFSTLKRMRFFCLKEGFNPRRFQFPGVFPDQQTAGWRGLRAAIACLKLGLMPNSLTATLVEGLTSSDECLWLDEQWHVGWALIIHLFHLTAVRQMRKTFFVVVEI